MFIGMHVSVGVNVRMVSCWHPQPLHLKGEKKMEGGRRKRGQIPAQIRNTTNKKDQETESWYHQYSMVKATRMETCERESSYERGVSSPPLTTGGQDTHNEASFDETALWRQVSLASLVCQCR